MAIYLFTYALYFAILGVGLRRKNTRRWVVAATLPMFALVWLRGTVGVDLPMYVQSIEVIQQSGGYTFLFEPGFEFLILALGHISAEPMISVKLIATITTLLLLSTKWRTNTAYQAIALGVIPYFYFDMTMNGLRYGLAFAIILASLNSLMSSQRTRYASSTILAASMQVSSLYLSGILQTLLKPNWKHLLLMITFLIGVYLIGSDYFLLKASVSTELSKPGITAGVAPLFLSILVLTGCWNSKKILYSHRKKLQALFALTIATYGVTQLSYAGLRFQQLNYFLILLFVIYASEKSGLKQSKIILITLILAAVFGSAFRLNNFQSEADVGEAPFVPYKFYWSE